MIAWWLLFLTLTLLLLTLPFVATFKEWLIPTDVKPLLVVREFDGNVQAFAQSFQRYVTDNWSSHLNKQRTNAEAVERHILNHETILIINDPSALKQVQSHTSTKLNFKQRRALNFVALAPLDLNIPSQLICQRELFAQGDLSTGSGVVLKAALSQGDIRLGSSNQVARWAHSDNSVYADKNCRFLGRVSAQNIVYLDVGTHFERLNAKRLMLGFTLPGTFEKITGTTLNSLSLKDSAEYRRNKLSRIELPIFSIEGRSLDKEGLTQHIDGNLTVPAKHRITVNLIVNGKLTIEDGCLIQGSVKADKDLIIGNDVMIEAAVVSGENLTLGNRSYVVGPVIAENRALLKSWSHIGTLDNPTTITAPTIHIEPKVTAHGSVWAREHGELLLQPESGIKFA